MANTDRFYNAPEGPQTEPVDELPRRAHYDIHSDPDMFGGLIAKGFSELGQGLTTAGNVYGQIASDQATNNFMGNLSNLRSGFENTRGQDTMEAHDEYVQNVQKAYESARSTVPPGQQPEFDRFALRYKFNAESSAASHLAQQSNAWGQSVAQSKEQQAVAQISQTPNDDDNFKLNSDSMAKAAVNGIQLKMGITDLNNASPDAKEMVRNVYDQALARAWYTRIEAVRQSNPAQALQWQQQNAGILGKLGPEVQTQLKGYEKEQKVNGRIAEAGAAVGGGTAVAGAAPAQKSSYFIGDSIANGLQQAAGGQGNTVVGRPPAQVLKAIEDTPAGQLTGKQIVLSTGLSNNTGDLKSVQAQFDALKAKGVDPSNITVVGLGSRPDIARMSSQLQGIVQQNGAHYGGDFRAGADGVHPADYGSVLHSFFSPPRQGAPSGVPTTSTGGLSQDDKAHAAVGGMVNEGGAAALIRSREGFRSNAYWDVNHWRTGYGSDTVTLPDGSVRSVTQGTTVTQADADRDLSRRTRETETKVVLQTGVAGWNAQSPGAKAALTSMAYNYGHLPWDVTAAVRGGGSPQDIARTIEGHSGDNGGVNRARRMQEASIVLGGKIPEGFASAGGGGGGAPPSGGEMPPAPVPASFEGGGGGGGAAPSGGSAQLGSQPPAIGGAADQGGLSGPTPQSQPSIQQASTGGGGGFGAQPVQDKTGWDVVRDRTSTEMQWIYNHPSDDPDLDDQALGKLKERLTRATFAAELDAGTRARFSQEAVDRSLKLALGTNGGPRDPQGGFNALTDAFKRGLIDEPAYERGQAAIARSTGEEDKGSLGPGWSDFVTGKTPVHSEGDLQALLAHGDLTWNGYQHADLLLARRDKPDESGFLTQKKYAYEAAEDYLKWEMQGPTPGTSIRNPNGHNLMSDFSKIFETQELAYRKDHGNDMTGFDLFDTKKRQAVLDSIYSQRQKDKDMGQGGLTKPQADVEEQQWDASPVHPPAPHGFDQGSWAATVNNPPPTPDGFPLPRIEWDLRLRALTADPSPEVKQFWDKRYGPNGTTATGPTADDVLGRLKREAPPPEQPPAPPNPLFQGQAEIQPGQPAPGMAVTP